MTFRFRFPWQTASADLLLSRNAIPHTVTRNEIEVSAYDLLNMRYLNLIPPTHWFAS